jgi:hypothetical protein
MIEGFRKFLNTFYFFRFLSRSRFRFSLAASKSANVVPEDSGAAYGFEERRSVAESLVFRLGAVFCVYVSRR